MVPKVFESLKFYCRYLLVEKKCLIKSYIVCITVLRHLVCTKNMYFLWVFFFFFFFFFFFAFFFFFFFFFLLFAIVCGWLNSCLFAFFFQFSCETLKSLQIFQKFSTFFLESFFTNFLQMPFEMFRLQLALSVNYITFIYFNF